MSNGSRPAIHDWVQKADLQPDSDVDPNRSAVDETVSRVTGDGRWLSAAVDPDPTRFRRARLFQTRLTQLTLLFVRERHETRPVSDVMFLVDDARYLENALDRLGLRFRVCCHGGIETLSNVYLVR